MPSEGKLISTFCAKDLKPKILSLERYRWGLRRG